MSRNRRLSRSLCTAALALGLVGGAQAAEVSVSALTLIGPASTVFVPATDACDGYDVSDAPARAFRDDKGGIVLFALHFRNRALRGANFDRLKIDCRVALDSGGKDDPRLYDDKSWITATWTEDGRNVAALLHHEYHADEHEGRCRSKVAMECWFNTITAATSSDAGVTFARADPPTVVASAPFGQEFGQDRHRGFFNPSNIVAEGRARYFMASNTGWDVPGSDQHHGVCLFRSETPADPASWRAWNGTNFSAAFPDPYRKRVKLPDTCRPVGPFPGPVGAVVRHRASGAWIAVFMAKADDGTFPESGFYWTTSRNLLDWDVPRLLLAGTTLYDDSCKGKGDVIAYPSILDPAAQGRNFDDAGDTAILTYASLAREGCRITDDRRLMRRALAIKVWP